MSSPTIDFRCSACTKPLRAPTGLAGKSIHCPQCKSEVTVPKLDKPDEYGLAGEPPASAARPAEHAAPATKARRLQAHLEGLRRKPPQPRATRGVIFSKSLQAALGMFLLAVVVAFIPGVRGMAVFLVLGAVALLVRGLWQTAFKPARDTPRATVNTFIVAASYGPAANFELAVDCLTPLCQAQWSDRGIHVVEDFESGWKQLCEAQEFLPDISLVEWQETALDENAVAVEFAWGTEVSEQRRKRSDEKRKVKWILVRHQDLWYLAHLGLNVKDADAFLAAK